MQIEVVKMKDLLSQLKTANQNDGINTTFEGSWVDELDLLA